mgnify:CR=1 FL=1
MGIKLPSVDGAAAQDASARDAEAAATQAAAAATKAAEREIELLKKQLTTIKRKRDTYSRDVKRLEEDVERVVSPFVFACSCAVLITGCLGYFRRASLRKIPRRAKLCRLIACLYHYSLPAIIMRVRRLIIAHSREQRRDQQLRSRQAILPVQPSDHRLLPLCHQFPRGHACRRQGLLCARPLRLALEDLDCRAVREATPGRVRQSEASVPLLVQSD